MSKTPLCSMQCRMSQRPLALLKQGPAKSKPHFNSILLIHNSPFLRITQGFDVAPGEEGRRRSCPFCQKFRGGAREGKCWSVGRTDRLEKCQMGFVKKCSFLEAFQAEVTLGSIELQRSLPATENPTSQKHCHKPGSGRVLEHF